MWGAAQVTALKAHSGIHPLKKNFHLYQPRGFLRRLK